MIHTLANPFTTMLLSIAFAVQIHAQGTAFTYQGFLISTNGPAQGAHEFEFALHDAEAASSLIGTPVVTNLLVADGLFMAMLDFGADVFSGQSLWLEIGVRSGGSGGAFTTLSPRQPLAPAPYAIRALSASTLPDFTITSAMLADGSVTGAKIAPGAVNHLGSPDGSPLNALQVDTNGLVGLGTTNPAAGLHIASSLTFLNPTVLSVLLDESGGLTNLAGATAVAVEGNLAAVAANGDDGVTLIDIANPLVPILRSQFRDGDGAFTNLNGATAVALKSGLLAVAALRDDAVTLISVTNPAAPVKLAELRDGVGEWNELDGATSVALLGNLMAVAAELDNAVTLVDIANPSAPAKHVEMKDGSFGFTNLAGTRGVALSGNLLAIAAAHDDAVTLVDVTDPANPVKLSELRDGVGEFNHLDGAASVALSGNLLAIAAPGDDAVTLVDVSNPASPVKLAEWRDGLNADFLLGVRTVAFAGTRLAVATPNEPAITVFDVGNPASPTMLAVARQGVGGFNHLHAVIGVAFAGDRLMTTAQQSHAVTLLELTTAPAGLSSAGWVGIGTTQPAAPLHVVGNVVVEGADRVELNATRVELGLNTTARGSASTAMGNFTTASGSSSTAMGTLTTASGFASMAMGNGTTASGFASMAMGEGSSATHSYTLAAGRRAKANHQGAFVWADSLFADFASTGDDQFLIRASGGVGIGTTSPDNSLHVHKGSAGAVAGHGNAPLVVENSATCWINILSPSANERGMLFGDEAGGNAVGAITFNSSATPNGLQFRTGGNATRMVIDSGGNVGIGTTSPTNKLHVNGGITCTVLTQTSDRHAKENLEPVSPAEVLAKIAALPLSRWTFKEHREGGSHLGPMAQDFHAAFGLGNSDTTIAAIDADGVALAAIQGLNQKVEVGSQKSAVRIQKLEVENAELKQRLEALEQIIRKQHSN